LIVPRVGQTHPSPYSHFHLSWDELRRAIIRAENELRSAPLDTDQSGGRHAILAAWNPTGNRSDIRLIQIRNGISITPGFTVQVRPWNGLPPRPGVELYNGVNTRYAITHPMDWYVLAIKVNARSEPGAVYVPYNPAYQTPEIAAVGLQDLTQVILSAEKTIARRHVRSALYPDRLITDLFEAGANRTTLDADGRMLLALLTIEHIDVQEFQARGAAWTADKMLTTVALNGPRTYRYAVSSAGAGGLAQFILPTYRDIRNRYPAAALPESFETAMRNHVTAVIAQYCLMDRIFKTLVDTGFALPRDQQIAGRFLAAAYNAGEHRAIPAYREYQRCLTTTRRHNRCTFAHGLPAETQNYVREYSAVYWHLFGRR
jgi:hypothetical protein